MLDAFYAARRERWQRLETLLAAARGGGSARLSAGELDDLGRLYRQATSDLAVARRDFPRARQTRYLEGLVGRAHPVLYRDESRDWRAVRTFATRGFPATFRATARYTLLAFALFAIPFALAFLAVRLDPTTGRMIVPSRPFVEQVEQGQSWLEIERAQRGLTSAFIMTNNIQVCFFAFAGGMLFGIGTVYVLLMNGLQIGAVAGLASSYGLGDDLAGFVAPHGGIELSVIFIAGGAGLQLGHALLAPGLRTRAAALAAAAQRAIRLLIGCVPLLAIAGLFEGFVSPSGLPLGAKLLIGAVNLAWLYAYLLLAGRKRPARPYGSAARGR
jgi:uncharacterized membrane protein SpoIIM required for sporulation